MIIILCVKHVSDIDCRSTTAIDQLSFFFVFFFLIYCLLSTTCGEIKMYNSLMHVSSSRQNTATQTDEKTHPTRHTLYTLQQQRAAGSHSGLCRLLGGVYRQGIIYTPYWGWYTPLLTLTHTHKLCSPIGCVFTVLVVYSYTAQDFRHQSAGRSRQTLGVGVFRKCLYNYTYPKTVFYCSQILSVTSRFTSVAYVSCKCSPKCIIQVLCTYGFIHQAADTWIWIWIIVARSRRLSQRRSPTLIRSSHADLKSYPQLVHDTPPKQKS